ncbi:hypothetical protein FRC07_000565 [Ceratobasidium sp. 392]|nr:hypothetical protein FRC07_000565 [Ceratobasidium sp. 392]
MVARAIRTAIFGYSETSSIKMLSMGIADSCVAVTNLLSDTGLTNAQIFAALKKSHATFERESGKIVECERAAMLVHAIIFKLGRAHLSPEWAVVLSAVRKMLDRAHVQRADIGTSGLYLRVYEPSSSPTPSF